MTSKNRESARVKFVHKTATKKQEKKLLVFFFFFVRMHVKSGIVSFTEKEGLDTGSSNRFNFSIFVWEIRCLLKKIIQWSEMFQKDKMENI